MRDFHLPYFLRSACHFCLHNEERFLNIAQGSLEESRYYLILTEDLGYGQTERLMTSLDEASRLLSSYAGAILSSVGEDRP